MATATKAAEPTVSDILDEAMDVMEDTLDLMEAKTAWLKTTNAKLLLVGLSALAVGATASYVISAKRLQAKYQKIADEQVADVKDHYSAIRKDDVSLEELASKYPDDDPAQETAKEIMDTNGYTHYNRAESVAEEIAVEEETEEVVVTAVERNVFESDSEDTYFDFEEELARREANPESPHVITKEEFDENDTDFDQISLTYYDGDDILTDSNDQPINDLDNVIGFENLLRFGHGSGDPKIVYIRNPKLGSDIEVVHSDGKFAKEVLGFDDELQHSSKRQPRKFRASDE